MHACSFIQLTTAHEELNKRISEHDKNMTTGAIKTDITLAVSTLTNKYGST